MRTTVRLPESLMERARSEARRRGITLTRLIEEGVMLATTPQSPKRERITLPVDRHGGGVFPHVDLDNSAQLLAIMEDE